MRTFIESGPFSLAVLSTVPKMFSVFFNNFFWNNFESMNLIRLKIQDMIFKKIFFYKILFGEKCILHYLIFHNNTTLYFKSLIMFYDLNIILINIWFNKFFHPKYIAKCIYLIFFHKFLFHSLLFCIHFQLYYNFI